MQLRSADEAKALTISCKSDRSRENLESIIQKIEEAICQGRTSIGVDTLLEYNRALLESKGYKIVSGGRYNEIEYNISWK